MGIESDQVVYEYLSRVGDVAQQRQLPSATRMRLVNELRGEIDRRRARAAVDSPAAVRRIIARLGTPDEIVAAAGGTSPAPQTPVASVPAQPEGRDEPAEEERPKGLRRLVPRPRPAQAPAADDAPPPPHLASTADLGGSAFQPDWWRVDSSAFGPGDDVPGFVGGVEIPEMLRRPPTKEQEALLRKKAPAEEPEEAAAAEADVPEADAAPRRRRLLPRRPTLPAGRWSNPLLLLAAALLVAGAVLGNLIALLLGWLIAWGSRRLSDAETKWAVMILPGLALTAGVIWLWGRTDGRWGDPIAEGHMNAALSDTWPWVLRGAAVASALFIVWRSQRAK